MAQATIPSPVATLARGVSLHKGILSLPGIYIAFYSYNHYIKHAI